MADLPGMALVHGAGISDREFYAPEAESFARAGMVTLTYDRRGVGYSLTERSYSQLADDAAAAAAALRGQPEVDPGRVGLWGLSEGGWVAPLAASRAPQTAFVIVVGASGVPPLRQMSWAEATKAAHAGVRGSLVRAGSRTSWRVILGTGMFPEPYYDPVPALQELTLPILGIWGAKDRVSPPVESMAVHRSALEEAGNRHYKLQTFADAEHTLRVTSDGFDYLMRYTARGLATDDFAPGYVDLVGSWVARASARRAPAVDVQGAGQQHRRTVPVPPLTWWESTWVHAAALVVLVGGFGGFALSAPLHRFRGSRPRPAPWAAWVLVVTGLLTVVGTLAYLASLVLGLGGGFLSPGPLLAGRPLPWLALQLLAVTAVVSFALTIVRWRQAATAAGQIRYALLAAAGVVFVPWALYWGLVLP
ncbi:MAG: prolyl oligopeptidase family serine peptidase [Actinophytocola sp.]|nr:prolyl oligopeptidase family serine peptidase [Actinophytocola sp.]